MNKITIGRDANSSIVVPGRYTTVSESHVTIERLGKNYTLIDHSTNGTYVNGVKVLNDSCHIVMTDTITLGQKYALDMTQVEKLLADEPQAEPALKEVPTEEPKEEPKEEPVVEVEVEEVPKGASKAKSAPKQEREEPAIVDKWSWGGFGLDWIYAVCNGVWWPIVIPVLFLLSHGIGILFFWIPVIGQILSSLVGLFYPIKIVIKIILGIKGHSFTWDKYKGDPEKFEKKQKTWDKVGLIYFIVKVVLIFLNVVVLPVFLVGLGLFGGIAQLFINIADVLGLMDLFGDLSDVFSSMSVWFC